MQFSVLESTDAVRELSDEWTALLDGALDPHPFVSPDWLLTWWGAFGDPSWRMQFGVLRRDGALVGVAPLYVSKERRWGRTAQVLRFWENPYSNRIALLVSAEIAPDAIRELVEGLYSHLTVGWDIADLGPMVLADETTQLLVAELSDGRAGRAIVEGYASPYRDLPESAELLEQSLGSSFKKSLRRKINKANRSNVRIEITADPQQLPVAMEISEETWQHDAGTGIGSSQEIKAFYEGIAAAFGETGHLQLAFLSIDEIPIAFELNVTLARTLYNLKVGYLKTHNDLSPGIVLRHHVLCHAIEQGFEEFDFLGASEGYKLHWASGTRPHGNVLFARRRGYWWILYLLRYAARPFLQEKLPWVLHAKRQLQERLTTISKDN